MKPPALAIFVLPVAIVAALSGCGGSPAPSTPAPSALESCVTGHTWTLDVADAASQNLAHFQGLGLPVTALTGSGTQTMEWKANGHVDIETALDYVITVTEDADNVLVITQAHRGPATGTFTIAGAQALPSGWDSSGYTVTSSATKNGEPLGGSPMDFPDSQLGGVEFALTCSGNSLTTLATDGFVNYHWTHA
ncbi:MAG: hypothetical protein ABJB03_01320 [Rhodoglobus sp.]